jgi:hypothetical protein
VSSFPQKTKSSPQPFPLALGALEAVPQFAQSFSYSANTETHNQREAQPKVEAPLHLEQLPKRASYCLPTVLDLDRLPDWRTRNQAITDWYDQMDQALSLYLGEPNIPSWARFAKHASYNAGLALTEIERSLGLISAVLEAKQLALDALCESSPKAAFQAIGCLLTALTHLKDVADSPDSLQSAAIGGMLETGCTSPETRLLVRRFHHSPNSWANAWDCLTACFSYLPKIFNQLPKTKLDLEILFSTINSSNSSIYSFMAPKLDTFLRQELLPDAPKSGQDEIKVTSNNDSSSTYLDRALEIYKKIHRGYYSGALRPILALRANLLATYGEQLCRVQPNFAQAGAVIDRMKPLMSFSYPKGGISQLAPYTESWANLNQRFGIDPKKTTGDRPLSAQEIDEKILLSHSDRRFVGTIGELLFKGTLNKTIAESLRTSPPPLTQNLA